MSKPVASITEKIYEDPMNSRIYREKRIIELLEKIEENTRKV